MSDFELFSADAFSSAGIRSWPALARHFQENLRRFTANNSLRIKEMMRYGPSGVRTAFQKIPLFLQMNHPNVPGYMEGCDGSMGIAGFERSGFARLFLKQHPDRCLREILVRYPCIQSLTLIGSCGSIGHTRFSDLDYWVCVDPEVSPTYKSHLLARKLKKIEDWASEHHGLEVHFFLMNVGDIRANCMGALDEDSSGDVMPSLLKEEFYRTLLHVAGRIPLWWAMPAGVEESDYRYIAENLSLSDVTAFNPHDCLDLGFPHLPEPRELLGAAMWQTYKSIRDPFKAVIKMVLVLEEVDADLKAPLLCEQLKNTLFRVDPSEFPVDPYWHTVRRAEAHMRKYPEYLELVRTAIWYKLENPYGTFGPGANPGKTRMLEILQRDWAWSSDKINDLKSYPAWPERRKIALGEDMKSLLLDLYSRIASKLRLEHPEKVKIQDENLILLNAQILSRFGHSGSVVDELPSVFHRNALPNYLTVSFDQGEWRLSGAGESGDHIYSSTRLARVAAWLIHNQLWRSKSNLQFQPFDRPVKKSALLHLLEELSQHFKPLNIGHMRDKNLLAHPEGPGVLVVNLEEGNVDSGLSSAELIYRTSLGELCHEVFHFQRFLTEQEKYYQLAQFYWAEHAPHLSGFHVVAPPGQVQETLKDRVTQALNEAGRRQGMDLTGTRSNLKLDLSFDWKPSMTCLPEFDRGESESAPGIKPPKARLDLD